MGLGKQVGQDTENLGRRSTLRKLYEDISPRPILPISQLCKLPDLRKCPKVNTSEGTKALDDSTPTTFKK